MRESRDWVRLDNAAKIYPAASSRKWSSGFRYSATLTEPVDPAALQQALERLRGRFPIFFMRLRRGLFWYYLEQGDGCPPVVPELPYPCAPLTPRQNGGFSFRVLWYRNRIAAEFFHVIADGMGGLTFFKTLVAEYLTLRGSADIPRGDDIFSCEEPYTRAETEDSFLRYAGGTSLSRAESSAWHMSGTREGDGFVHVTTGLMPAAVLAAKAREYRASVNTFLVAVALEALLAIQESEGLPRRFRKPVKVCVPINLRRMFPSRTLRNFSSFVNPGVDPRLGSYTFEELIAAVYHYMGANTSRQLLGARFSSNVLSEKNALLRFTPLVLKDLVLKLAFVSFGDTKSSTTITNVGVVTLPPEMEARVSRLELVLGPLNVNPISCAVLTYRDTLAFNVVRTIREPRFEREFFTRLVKLGIPVRIESNDKPEEELKCPTA